MNTQENQPKENKGLGCLNIIILIVGIFAIITALGALINL
jgi:hypothetical protein